jgi:competence protein ComEA
MGEMRGRMLVMAVLALLAVSVGGLYGAMTVTPPPTPPTAVGGTASPTTHHTLETYAVHVSGMVVSPGVVHVFAGAIVADAVEAAGGLRPAAQADRINLAAPVGPGDQIVVPGPDSPAGAGSVGDSRGGSISLNTSTAKELEALPGVGAVLADRIVAHRTANGRFNTVEDLLDVPGIGEAKLAAIRDLVRP